MTITLYEPDLDISSGEDPLPGGLTFTVSGAKESSINVSTIEATGYKFKEVAPGKFQLEIPALKRLKGR